MSVSANEDGLQLVFRDVVVSRLAASDDKAGRRAVKTPRTPLNPPVDLGSQSPRGIREEEETISYEDQLDLEKMVPSLDDAEQMDAYKTQIAKRSCCLLGFGKICDNEFAENAFQIYGHCECASIHKGSGFVTFQDDGQAQRVIKRALEGSIRIHTCSGKPLSEFSVLDWPPAKGKVVLDEADKHGKKVVVTKKKIPREMLETLNSQWEKHIQNGRQRKIEEIKAQMILRKQKLRKHLDKRVAKDNARKLVPLDAETKEIFRAAFESAAAAVPGGRADLLSTPEFMLLFHKLGLSLVEKQVDNMLADVSKDNGDDTTTAEGIDLDTWVLLLQRDMRHEKYTQQDYQTFFRLIDFDRGGDIGFGELQDFMHAVGLTVGDWEANAMIQYACDYRMRGDKEDSDGRVGEKRFVYLLQHIADIKDHVGRSSSKDADANKEEPTRPGRDPRELWNQLHSYLVVANSVYRLWAEAQTSTMDEEVNTDETQVLAEKCFFFHPAAVNRQLWDLALLPMFMYVMMTMPYRLCFDADEPALSAAWWIDFCIDLFFMFDVVMNFRTAVEVRDPKSLEMILITDTKKVAKMYMAGWFWIDAASCFPAGLMELVLDDGQGEKVKSENEESTLKANNSDVKLLKVFRYLRLAKNLSRLSKMNKVKALLGEYEEKIASLAVPLKLLKLGTILFFMGHIFACIWYAIGTQDQVIGGAPDENGNPTPSRIVKGWANEKHYSRHISPSQRYTEALYQSLTNVAPDYALTDTEKLYIIFQHVMYESFFGFLVGTFASIVASASLADQKKQEKLSEIKAFSTMHKVPATTRRKIHRFYDYMFSYRTALDENEILAELPETLRFEATSEMVKTLQDQIPFFKGFQKECVVKLALGAKRLQAHRNDVIACEGAVATELYFVIAGAVKSYIHYATPFEVPINTFVIGQFFGELTYLTNDNTRRFTVVAENVSELIFFPFKTLEDVEVSDPEFKQRLQSFGQLRWSRDRDKAKKGSDEGAAHLKPKKERGGGNETKVRLELQKSADDTFITPNYDDSSSSSEDDDDPTEAGDEYTVSGSVCQLSINGTFTEATDLHEGHRYYQTKEGSNDSRVLYWVPELKGTEGVQKGKWVIADTLRSSHIGGGMRAVEQPSAESDGSKWRPPRISGWRVWDPENKKWTTNEPLRVTAKTNETEDKGQQSTKEPEQALSLPENSMSSSSVAIVKAVCDRLDVTTEMQIKQARELAQQRQENCDLKAQLTAMQETLQTVLQAVQRK